MAMQAVKHFLRLESASGVLLMIATVIAIICNNSALASWYGDLLDVNLSFMIGTFVLSKPILLWINEGLMTVFFLLVGLELKRELIEGELKEKDCMMLPVVAAIGGICVPALIYVFINRHSAVSLQGWAIPIATDIAFALGVLSLFGKRIPPALKLFLLTLAIVDDVGAIVVIAVFHTQELSSGMLIFSVLMIFFLFSLNMAGVKKITPYVLLGSLLWLGVLKSGVHATLAGVVLAFAIPLQSDKDGFSPLRFLEHVLHPWVAFLVMPLFAFANAGLSFSGIEPGIFHQPIVLGIILGLFVGKQVGVMLASYLVIKLRWGVMPAGCSWLDVYGVSLLCGIGFTMSLFIGSLAFKDLLHYHAQVRFGVLVASLLSGVAGCIVLLWSQKCKAAANQLKGRGVL